MLTIHEMLTKYKECQQHMAYVCVYRMHQEKVQNESKILKETRADSQYWFIDSRTVSKQASVHH